MRHQSFPVDNLGITAGRIRIVEFTHVTLLDIAWLAGLIEGEGYFTVTKRPKYPKAVYPAVGLAMTDGDVVARAAGMMRAISGSDANVRTRRHGLSTKPMYAVSFCGSYAVPIMRTLLPFMGQRRKARINELLDAFAANPHVSRRRPLGATRDFFPEDFIEMFEQAGANT